MSVNDLSAVLWRERELLELLTFKLEEEQLLLTAGRSRWVVARQPRGRAGARPPPQHRPRAQRAERRASPRSGASTADAPLRDVVAAAPAGPWGEILAVAPAARCSS